MTDRSVTKQGLGKKFTADSANRLLAASSVRWRAACALAKRVRTSRAVPPRRLNELAKYGMSADASLIRRHPDGRRMATLLATVRLLEAKSVDDTLELLELLDLLMATEPLNKAQTAANKEKVRKHPKRANASARLAVAVEALFESDGRGRGERATGRPAGRAADGAGVGGGLVAAVDGMRFVVPVPAVFARTNRKFVGSRRGMTWLNAMLEPTASCVSPHDHRRHRGACCRQVAGPTSIRGGSCGVGLDVSEHAAAVPGREGPDEP